MLSVNYVGGVQHAVRAGVLRSHVDEHFIGAYIEFDDTLICNGRGHSNDAKKSVGKSGKCRSGERG